MSRRVNEYGETIVDTAIDGEWGSNRGEMWLEITPSREIRYIKPEVLATAFRIKKVIFNPPATIVLWEDGTKTVVKANEPSKKMIVSVRGIELEDVNAYDPEKGLAMCIAKRALGNKGNYYNAFKKWLKENE